MKTYIYDAEKNRPIKVSRFGVGDVVTLRGYGDVYPSYDRAYAIFGKGIPTRRGIEMNLFRVVGFILHSINDRDLMVAVQNSNEFFLTDINNVRLYRYWTPKTSTNRFDVIYVNTVDVLNKSERISSDDLKNEFNSIFIKAVAQS